MKSLVAIRIIFMLSLFPITIFAQNIPSSKKLYQNIACATAAQYVELINHGKYDLIGNVFSKNATYMGPDGKTRHGSKEIGTFYTCFLSLEKPVLRGITFFSQGNECLMELERKNQKGKFVPEAIDHFTVDSAGKATKFIVYLRPRTQATPSIQSALSKCNAKA